MGERGGRIVEANGGAAVTAGLLSQELTSIRFAAVARRLSEAAREIGIDAPGFRSPPRLPGVRRSIRHEADGSATISVALRGRPGLAVIGDLVDGLVVASEVDGLEAAQLRDELWLVAANVLDDESEVTMSRPPARQAA